MGDSESETGDTDQWQGLHDNRATNDRLGSCSSTTSFISANKNNNNNNTISLKNAHDLDKHYADISTCQRLRRRRTRIATDTGSKLAPRDVQVVSPRLNESKLTDSSCSGGIDEDLDDISTSKRSSSRKHFSFESAARVVGLVNRLAERNSRRYRERFLHIESDIPVMLRGVYRVGYRPCYQPWSYYLCSLFFVHNETFNVWTHLLGGLYAAYYIISSQLGIDNAKPLDYVQMVTMTTTAYVLLTSATAHLFHSKSPLVHLLLFSMDYQAIAVSSLTSNYNTFKLFSFRRDWTMNADRKSDATLAVILCCLGLMFSLGQLLTKCFRFNPNTKKFFKLVIPTIYGLYSVCWEFRYIYLLYSRDSPGCFVRSSPEMCRALLKCFIVKFLFGLFSFIFFAIDLPRRVIGDRADFIFHGHQLYHLTAIGFIYAHWQSLRVVAATPNYRALSHLPLATYTVLFAVGQFIIHMLIISVSVKIQQRRRQKRLEEERLAAAKLPLTVSVASQTGASHPSYRSYHHASPVDNTTEAQLLLQKATELVNRGHNRPSPATGMSLGSWRSRDQSWPYTDDEREEDVAHRIENDDVSTSVAEPLPSPTENDRISRREKATWTTSNTGMWLGASGYGGPAFRTRSRSATKRIVDHHRTG